MISPKFSRSLVAHVNSTTALFTRGLDKIVVATTEFHGRRLIASVDTAYDKAEKLEEHAAVIQAAATSASTAAVLAADEAENYSFEVADEIDALGLGHLV